VNIVDLALTAAFFTASFDLILVFTVGGTIRFAQVILLFVMVAALSQILQSRRILWSRGASALALWCGIQGGLVTQSAVPAISFQFFVLLLFTLSGVFAVLQLYGCSDRVGNLMKAYLASFAFVAAFGIFQLISPSLHLGIYLVRQWIRYKQIPRINGFSYEPSYFVTYIMMGWISIVDLKLSKARIVEGRRWRWLLLLLTGALFLSTSKTATILMSLEGCLRLAPLVWGMTRRQVNRIWQGSLVVRLPHPRTVLRVAVVVLVSIIGIAGVVGVIGIGPFVAGSGIAHSAAHSTLERAASFEDTLTVIRRHPWIGLSLGGVPAEVAALHGQQVKTQEDLRRWWGSPILFDVLAASGILGFIPFVWFFYSITLGERQLIQQMWPDERAKWLRALIRALIFEWLCFFGEQNIMRVYFWFHVTMVVVVGYNLRYFRTRMRPVEGLVPAGVTP